MAEVTAALSRTISAALAVESKAGILDPAHVVALPSVPTVRVRTPFMRLNQRTGGVLDTSETTDANELVKAIVALKQISDVREGVSGSVLDKHLTMRDLMNEGVLSLNIGAIKYTGGVADALVLGSGYVDPRPVLLTPPAPTNLTASAAFKSVILRWDLLNYANHAYVEIWRHTADVIGAATLIGTSTANVYSDASGTVGTTYYYWVRAVAITAPNGTSGVLGPFNAVNGVAATLGAIIGTDLADLAVTAGKLSQGTYPNINLVPNPGAEDGTEAWIINRSDGSGTATFVSTTSDKTSGTSSFKLSKSSAGVGRGIGCRAFPVIPGETYAVSVRMRADAASALGRYVIMEELTTKPTTGYIGLGVGTVDARTSASNLAADQAFTSGWTTYSYTYVVPAGIYWAALALYIWATSTPAVDLYVDDCKVGRQITAEFLAANSIAVGTLAVQNGAIVNAMIGTAAIDDAKIANLSAVKITAGTLDVARLGANSITAAKIAANTLTASEISTTALSSDNTLTRNLTVRDGSGNVILASGTLLAGAYFAGKIGGDNLLFNSMMADVNGDNTPDGWNLASFGSTGTSSSISATGGPDNGAYAIASATGLGSGGSDFVGFSQGNFSCPLPSAGGPVAISAYVRGSGGTIIDHYMEFKNAAGTVLTSVSNAIGGFSSSNWLRFSAVFTAPAGTTQVFTYMWIRTTPSGGAGALHLSRPQIEVGDVATQWGPGLRDRVGIGNQLTSSNISTYIASAAITSAYIGSLNADVINAGSIRGINVTAGTLATKGTYLTVLTSAADSTVNVKNTADFASSGTAVVYEFTVNDFDSFTYSGKTSTTLTGCSGVLAHAVGCTVIPAGVKSTVIDSLTNDIRSWDDRGDGTYESVVQIGASGPNDSFSWFGSQNGTMYGVRAFSKSRSAIRGQVSSGGTGLAGVEGRHVGAGHGVAGDSTDSSSGGVFGTNTGGYGAWGFATSGTGVRAEATTGYGLHAIGNSTKAPLLLEPLSSAPSTKTEGSIYYDTTLNRVMFTEGAAWYKLAIEP